MNAALCSLAFMTGLATVLTGFYLWAGLPGLLILGGLLLVGAAVALYDPLAAKQRRSVRIQRAEDRKRSEGAQRAPRYRYGVKPQGPEPVNPRPPRGGAGVGWFRGRGR